jgi:hypothetical protein
MSSNNLPILAANAYDPFEDEESGRPGLILGLPGDLPHSTTTSRRPGVDQSFLLGC